MAIKFRDEKGGTTPAKKEVGGMAYVSEEPATKKSEPAADLPFAKPVRSEKKPHKPKR